MNDGRTAHRHSHVVVVHTQCHVILYSKIQILFFFWLETHRTRIWYTRSYSAGSALCMVPSASEYKHFLLLNIIIMNLLCCASVSDVPSEFKFRRKMGNDKSGKKSDWIERDAMRQREICELGYARVNVPNINNRVMFIYDCILSNGVVATDIFEIYLLQVSLTLSLCVLICVNNRLANRSCCRLPVPHMLLAFNEFINKRLCAVWYITVVLSVAVSEFTLWIGGRIECTNICVAAEPNVFSCTTFGVCTFGTMATTTEIAQNAHRFSINTHTRTTTETHKETQTKINVHMLQCISQIL